MFATSLLWIPFTLLAAAGQTARNAMQRELTATLGTVGATHVRFLFGFPFALCFLAGVLMATGLALPRPPAVFWPWVLARRAARRSSPPRLMLATMNDRSFVVTIAYIKTEAIQARSVRAVFPRRSGDDRRWSPRSWSRPRASSAMSLKDKGAMRGRHDSPSLLGLFSGAMFALSADRLSRRDPVARAAELRSGRDIHGGGRTAPAGGLADALSRGARPRRAACHRARLAAVAVRRLHGRDRVASSGSWPLRSTSVANVRTLALVEVLFAQAISFFIFKQATTKREALGMR